MSEIYAIITGGVVTNAIVASAAFISAYFPAAIRIDNLTPQPGIGWTYNGSAFNPPA